MYDLLIVPSPGAFVDGAATFAHRLRDEKYDNFDPNAPCIRPTETIYLPFTADIGDASPVPSLAIKVFQVAC